MLKCKDEAMFCSKKVIWSMVILGMVGFLCVGVMHAASSGVMSGEINKSHRQVFWDKLSESVSHPKATIYSIFSWIRSAPSQLRKKFAEWRQHRKLVSIRSVIEQDIENYVSDPSSQRFQTFVENFNKLFGPLELQEKYEIFSMKMGVLNNIFEIFYTASFHNKYNEDTFFQLFLFLAYFFRTNFTVEQQAELEDTFVHLKNIFCKKFAKVAYNSTVCDIDRNCDWRLLSYAVVVELRKGVLWSSYHEDLAGVCLGVVDGSANGQRFLQAICEKVLAAAPAKIDKALGQFKIFIQKLIDKKEMLKTNDIDDLKILKLICTDIKSKIENKRQQLQVESVKVGLLAEIEQLLTQFIKSPRIPPGFQAWG